MLQCSIVISRVHSNLQNVRKLSLQTCKTKYFSNTLNLFHISEGQRPHVKKFGTNKRGSKASQQQLFLKPVWTIFISWLSPHTTLFCCCCLFFYLLTILCTPFQLLLFSNILYTKFRLIEGFQYVVCLVEIVLIPRWLLCTGGRNVKYVEMSVAASHRNKTVCTGFLWMSNSAYSLYQI